MKIFQLYNRDGADLYLEQVDEESYLYTLECDKKHSYVLDYCRIVFNDDPNILDAVDPSGGPYLTVGYDLGNGYKVKSIIILDDKIMFIIKKEEI